jgi:ATP-binding cassette, subfamily B, bacterial MsbA
MLEQGRQHAWGYTISFIFMALGAAATGAAAYLMKDVINEVFLARNSAAIFVLAGAVILIYALKGIASYGQDVTLARIGNRIVASVQERLFDHLLAQDVPFFADKHSTQFIAQQSFMAAAMRNALNLVVTAIGRDALTLVGLLTVMLVQDLWMSLGTLLVAPVVVFSVRKLVRRSRKIVETEFSSFSRIMEITQETAQGIRVVKSFGLAGLMRAQMENAVRAFELAATRLAMVGARSSPIMEFLGGVAVAGVIVYGGWRVTSGGQSPGEFFSFIMAFLLAYEPAKRLARFNVDLGASLVGVRMLYAFLDSPALEPDKDERPDLVITRGRVELRGVSFAYRPGEPVLREFSLVAEDGRTTALIGSSGSGKSTVFSLLQGFYHPDAGRILVDGQDIAGVNLASLRRAVAVVSQDAFLFSGSVRANIRHGRLSASDAEILAAARAAHAHEFIERLAGGYNAPVGEHGQQLSGGQKQRIAIARAILKDAPIILLDEATSALDPESERHVRDGLAHLSKGRTVLLIAHRRETYAHADIVVEIERGRTRPGVVGVSEMT